jgi:hypothetical protein
MMDHDTTQKDSVSMPTKYRRQWDMQSFTDSTKKPYRLSEAHDGHWECSCPDWINRRKLHPEGYKCKHLRFLIENLTAIERANPRWQWLARVQNTREIEAEAVGVRVDKYVVRPRLLDVAVPEYAPVARGRRL